MSFDGEVVLDDFDKYVDGVSGDAQEILEDVYGDRVGSRTAESKIAGARQHIKHKKKLLSETGEFQYKKEKIKFAKDGSKTVEKIIQLSDTEINDSDAIMRKMGLKPIQWEFISCTLDRKAWQVTMKIEQGHDKDGNKIPDKPVTKTNYGFDCRLRVEPRQDKITIVDIRESLKDIKISEHKEYNYNPSKCMLEIPIVDPHFGLLAYKEETGDADYNLDIAEEVFHSVINEIIERTSRELDYITYPVGQDLFHIDTTDGTTTSGTRVSTDGRWPQIWERGLKANIWAIEKLRKIAPVRVFYTPGNHDEMLSYSAVQAIAHHYHATDSVTIDGDKFPSPRQVKYTRYGVNTIGFGHLDRVAKKRIEKMMQVDNREIWGDTKYAEMHMGHKHSEEVWEAGGVLFRRLPSIAPATAWEDGKGYRGAVRKAQAFVWDKERGLRNVVNVNVV